MHDINILSKKIFNKSERYPMGIGDGRGIGAGGRTCIVGKIPNGNWRLF